MTTTTSSQTMSPPADELARRRRQILAELGLTEDELCERAHTTGLCADEWAALAELDELDCLRDSRASEHLLAG